MRRSIIIFLLFTSFLFGVQKGESTDHKTEALIQLNIDDMQSFDFLGFEREYALKLQYCVGSSVCFFKPSSDADLEAIVEDIQKYGKAKLYRPYRFKIY